MMTTASMNGRQRGVVTMDTTTEDSNNDVFSDTIERILMAVEAREASRAAVHDGAFEHSPSSSSKRAGQSTSTQADKNNSDGCQLLPQELQQLELLCASANNNHASTTTTTEASNGTNDNASNNMSRHGSLHEQEKEIEVKAGFGLVDGDTLTMLIPILEQHVEHASSINIVREAYDEVENRNGSVDQWLKNGVGYSRIAQVRQGLEAASIMLTIMTSVGVDRRVINEDSIEACIELMRQHLVKNVEPAINGTGHLLGPSTSSSSSPTKQKTSSSSPSPPPKKKTKKNRNNTTGHVLLNRELKKLYKPILSTVASLSVLLERVEILIRAVPIDDSPILTLCSSTLSTFCMDPVAGNESICRLLQVSSIALITAVFRKYPQHRTIILEDLFPVMLKLPTSKRNLRSFPLSSSSFATNNNTGIVASSSRSPKRSPIRNSSPSVQAADQQQCIQAMTALVVAMIQCCVVMPTVQSAFGGDGMDDSNTAPTTVDTEQSMKLTNGLANCQSVCDFFIAQLLHRCSRKGEDGGASEFRPLLSNIVDDLLVLQMMAEYPAAEMILISLCRRLSSDLLRASSINTNRSKAAHHVEGTYMTTAFEQLGKICAQISRNLKANREKPLKVSRARYEKAVESSADNDTASKQSGGGGGDGPSKEVNNCFCGRTGLVDTFMLDCDRCHAWFHGSCVGVTRDTIPESWFCDECQLQLMVMEQTQAFAVGGGGNGRTNNHNRKSSRFRAPEFLEDGGVAEVNETHVFRQLLLNYLSNLSGTTTSLTIQTAKDFFLAQWIKELDDLRHSTATEDETKEKKKKKGGSSMFDPGVLLSHYMDQWGTSVNMEHRSGGSSVANGFSHLPNASTNSNDPRPVLSDEGNSRLMLTFAATKSDMAVAFPRLLGIIVQLMSDKSVASLRKLSVKAISQVIEADPTLMLQVKMRNAVSQRFQDEAISVREAAVALVGNYVLQTPALANAFHHPLLARLNDSGVSVRKRTLKIFRDILVSNPSYQGTAVACAVMLQRAADPKEDDNVRDLVHALFQELWLEGSGAIPILNSARTTKSKTGASSTPIPPQAAQNQDPAGPTLVTPIVDANSVSSNRRKKSKSSKQGVSVAHLRAKAAAGQMVSVVKSAGTNDSLEHLLKEMLFGFADTDKGRKASERRKRQDSSKKHCSLIVEALIEDLVGLEEDRPDSKDEFSSQLVAILRTIAVFARVTPVLVISHIDPMLPYLKADNDLPMDDEAAIVSAVCDILSRLTPIMERTEVIQLSQGSVPTDLVKICYNFGSGALSFAIRTLAGLAHHRDADPSGPLQFQLMKLAKTFYGYLTKNIDLTDDFSSVTVKVRNNVHRALSVMGAICRHVDPAKGNTEDEIMIVDVSASEISWLNIHFACYDVFSTYLEKQDTPTKCAALRALGALFASQPRVMLDAQQRGVIAEVMAEDSPVDIQLDALRCWRDILLTEEKRVESGEAKAKLDSKKGITLSKKISGDQDGDATLVGGVLSKHSLRLFQMTTDQNAKIRLAVLDLLGHLLRQGLINPMETVPYLFALQGDVEANAIRSLALRLLITEGEKRPDMLRQRVCAGVKKAFVFQRTVYPDMDVTAVLIRQGLNGDKVESIFGQIFKESIRSSRKQREGLYRSLLGLFEVGEGEDDDGRRRKKNNESKSEDSYVEKLPLLSFAVQVLAHLPYNTANDPLFIIYNISSNATLHGAQLLDRLATFLRPHGLAPADEVDDSVDEEDELEQASKLKHPSRSQGVVAMLKSGFDIAEFADLCAEGASIVLLLRLKEFLQKAYNLSETRCIEFDPNRKERIADKAICVPDSMPAFNGSVIASVHDKDALVRQYAEFRQIMRSVDDMKPDDSGDESSGENHRVRKRTHSSVGEEEEEEDESD